MWPTPPALRFHGRYLLIRVLGEQSPLPTDDVLHLEGSANQGMGAVIFSAGVTQTRSVLVIEQLFQCFLLLLRHYLCRTAATDLPLHAHGCQDPVNCSHGHDLVSKVVYRKLFCFSPLAVAVFIFKNTIRSLPDVSVRLGPFSRTRPRKK